MYLHKMTKCLSKAAEPGLVDSVNTFDALNTVIPKPIAVKVQGGRLSLKLEPKSVTVMTVQE